MPQISGSETAGSLTRILLIEDNPADRELITCYLQELPFAIEVEAVSSVSAGKQCFESKNYDCVLLDHYLPDGNSLQLLKEISEASKQSAVIVLSGVDHAQAQQDLLSSGASDFLDKSHLDRDKLERAIRYARARQAYVQKMLRQEIENKALLRGLRDMNEHLDELVELRTAQFKVAQQVAREKAQQAEAASKVKSEFLATMSHEIRTPLNGVMGMLDLLRMTKLDSEQSDYVKTAQTSAEILLALLNDILDISRIEAGKLDLESTEFGLVDLVEQVVRIMKPRAEDKGLAFNVETRALSNLYLHGDAVRIRQILMNLADNAVKYTERGSVSIDVQLQAGKNLPEGKSWLQFKVRDTGIGIDPAYLEKIFQPFTQADSSYCRRYGGSGLGLAIVQRLLGMMGGSIRVESSPGKGSLFECQLPVVVTPVQLEDGTPPYLVTAFHSSGAVPGGSSTNGLGAVKVLVVEDNPTNQVVLMNILEKLGLEYIDCVENGREALVMLQQHDYDLVLMDCQLPEVDGYDATRQIRQNEIAHGKQAIPIIALTAHAMAGDREACLAAGMSDYVPKPVDVASLEKVIEKWSKDKIA